jgi:hypothetical protein
VCVAYRPGAPHELESFDTGGGGEKKAQNMKSPICPIFQNLTVMFAFILLSGQVSSRVPDLTVAQPSDDRHLDRLGVGAI